MNSNFTQPKSVKCSLCSGTHTHAYYCDVFQKARIVERFKLLTQIKTCYRCLRLDSEIDLINREQWWSRHEVNCKTDFYCKEGLCGSRTPNKQLHMLMCKFHVKLNEKNEDDFKKTLDKKLVQPGVKFFFFSPQVYQNLPEPVETSAPVSADSYPDVM